jgi:hypothetical protein
MSKKHIDPTSDTVSVTIKGTEYFLTFDFESLAQAEADLNEAGHNVNLLACMPVPTLATIRPLFAAAVRKHQPKLSYEDAIKLVTPLNAQVIAATLLGAWNGSMPAPEAVEGNAGAVE